MSWIKEVREGARDLDLSIKNLRKFGLIVGLIFVLIALWMLWKNHTPTIRIIFIGFGIFLLISGLVYPRILRPVYQVWMCLALSIGGLISRLILTILFFFVMTPIGLMLKLFGKKMLDIKQKGEKDTYWIPRTDRKVNYEKMY